MDPNQTTEQNNANTPEKVTSPAPATSSNQVTQPVSNAEPAPASQMVVPAPPAPEPAKATPEPEPAPSPAPAPESPIITMKEGDEGETEKKSGGVLSFIITIVIALALTQIINLFFFQSYRVFGSSMFSTLHNGDRLIVNKIPRTTTKITKKPFQPKRGQIIIFTSPKDPTLQLVKRVIGLPGERVVVKDGKLTVYNTEHPEGFNPDEGTDYQKNLPENASGENDITLAPNEIFVSGDNRVGSNSFDSRDGLGPVPEDLIIGTVSLRLWPLQSARFF